MKKIIASLLAGICTLSLLAGCQGKGDQLVMGLDDSFPPMGFRDEADELVGFDIDLAKAVADKMGVELKMQPIIWNNKEAELNGGTVDLLWNGLTMSESRVKEMTFTEPYLKNRMVLVVSKDSAIQSIADMKGKTVVLQKGSTAVDAVEAEENKAFKDGLKEVIEFADNLLCFTEVELGRADAVVLDEVVARYYLSKNEGKFRILDDALSDEFYGIAVKKGNTELRDKIQNALDELDKEGKIAEISKKWFGEDIYYRGE